MDEGLTRYIGVSNFNLQQVEDLLAQARVKPVVNQVELHPLLSQRKLVGTCLRKVSRPAPARSPFLCTEQGGTQAGGHAPWQAEGQCDLKQAAVLVRPYLQR